MELEKMHGTPYDVCAVYSTESGGHIGGEMG